MEFIEFKPSEARPDCVWLILGGRNTGKSTLLKYILYETRHHYDVGFALTKTQSTVNMFKSIFPPRFVFGNGYNSAKVMAYMEMAHSLTEKGKITHSMVAMDDLAVDKKAFKSEEINEISLNGRHSNCALFITSQDPMLLPSGLRDNVDYVISLCSPNKKIKMKLYEHYYGPFETYSDFAKVFERMTMDYGAIVLDKHGASKGKITDMIKFMRGTPINQQFHIGRPIFFALSKYLDKADEEKRKSRNVRSIIVG